ncbi:tRNA (5-methylaminomethyl-2-thiouridine)(34)-methyltransferase MnmD, partial [Spirochaetota bacterium]
MINTSENFKYKIIQTEDGTPTIYSDEYNESMHSIYGAYEEALYKHIYPSRILELNKKEISILDIGFGIGYNALASIIEFKNKRPNSIIDIVSFEKDRSFIHLLDSIQFNDERDEYYKVLKIALKEGQYKSGNLSIMIIYGDARESIKSFKNIKFNAVFQDPFSPGKNPELWTVEFFKEIYNIIDEKGILTTYSSAPQIRRGLIEAGFIIGKGPSVGKKREGTLASKTDAIPELSGDKIKSLMEDIKSTPYHDYTFKENREDILTGRINTMKKIRA